MEELREVWSLSRGGGVVVLGFIFHRHAAVLFIFGQKVGESVAYLGDGNVSQELVREG